LLIPKDFTGGRALLDTVGVWGSNPHAPTNIINNLAPLTSFPVTPVAIRIKKSDDLPCEPHSLYIVALNKASRAALETRSLPLTSRVRQYRQLNSTRNKISDVGDRNARFVIWLINDRLDANGLIP